MTFFITTFIFLMQFLWRYVEDLVGKGLSIDVLMQLMFYIAATLIPMSLPLALLLASLMTFGNLGENYELTAIKSAGISLQRVMVPLIILNIFISIGAFFISNDLIPVANLKMRALLYDIQRQKPEFNIKEGVFYNDIEGYSIRIGEKDTKTNLLKDLKIYDHTEERGNVSVTIADSGYMKMSSDESKLVITLFEGFNYIEIKPENEAENNHPHRKDAFKKQVISIDLTGFGLNRTDESLFRSNNKMLNLTQLKYYEDSTKVAVIDAKRNVLKTFSEQEYHKSYANTLAAPTNPSDNYRLINDTLYTRLSSSQLKATYNSAEYHARRVKDFVDMEVTSVVRRSETNVRYTIEWHRKFTLSIACIIFFFIGAPLGAIIRKGGFGMPLVISILFFLFYYIVSLTFEKTVKELILPPYAGMWIPSIILMPIGFLLTYMATHDSSFVNIDSYFNFFNKLFVNLKSKLKNNEDTASMQ